MGSTSQTGQLALGVMVRPSIYCPVGGPATVAAAAGPSSDFFTMTSSPTMSILTPSPDMDMSSAHPPGSGMAARSTFICLARMAMCDSRSTGEAVMTAVTPGGISSRPPSLAVSATMGLDE